MILEEIAKLETEIHTLKAHNALLQNMLLSFNQIDSELRTMKEMLQNILTKIEPDKAEHKRTEKNEKVKSAPEVFKCEECDFSAKSKAGLKTHIRLKHPVASAISNVTEPEPFTCGNCEFHFKSYDSDELLDHCRDIHGWYMCRNWLGGDGCEYEAKDKDDLEQHMVTRCNFRAKTTKLLVLICIQYILIS